MRRAAGSGVLDPPERHVVGYCGKFLRCFWCSTADITPLTIGLFSPSNHHAPSLRPPFPLFRRLCSAILPRGPGLGCVQSLLSEPLSDVELILSPASYFVISEPQNATQWVNGNANLVQWEKGLLDGVNGFDVEMARLSQDGLMLLAMNGVSPGPIASLEMC